MRLLREGAEENPCGTSGSREAEDKKGWRPSEKGQGGWIAERTELEEEKILAVPLKDALHNSVKSLNYVNQWRLLPFVNFDASETPVCSRQAEAKPPSKTLTVSQAAGMDIGLYWHRLPFPFSQKLKLKFIFLL